MIHGKRAKARPAKRTLFKRSSFFLDTNLSYADFSKAVNYVIDPRANRLKKTVFSMPEAMSLLSAFDIILK
jgi:hypothetical protein